MLYAKYMYIYRFDNINPICKNKKISENVILTLLRESI